MFAGDRHRHLLQGGFQQPERPQRAAEKQVPQPPQAAAAARTPAGRRFAAARRTPACGRFGTQSVAGRYGLFRLGEKRQELK